MLVLGRKRHEAVLIGGDVRVTVVDIFGNKVRLGIDAPSHILIHRQEIAERIAKQELEAKHGIAALANPEGDGC